MFGPIPTIPDDNLAYRAMVWEGCEVNKRRREKCLDFCKHDLFFYVNTFVVQYNPLRVGDEVAPFILRPRQKQVLARTQQRLFPAERTMLRLDMIWEKSRDEGASWMGLFLFDHRCLFFNRQNFLWVSHSADAVDKRGDPNCLFWKVRFMHEHLPEWIRRGVEPLKMRFWYPGTKSATTGQASTGRSGVGGRATAVGLDELGKMENAAEIIGQTQATGPRLMISTHYGVGTAFHQQCQRPDVAKERMHWSDNPEKNQGAYRYDGDQNRIIPLDPSFVYPQDFVPVRSADVPGGPYRGIRSLWYDAVEAQVGSRRDMALHYDIDPLASTWQFFDGAVIRQLIRDHARPAVWQGDVEIDRDTGRVKELARSPNGPLRLWIYPDGPASVPRSRYTIGADVAQGTGATPSCLSIGDASLSMKVGEYANAEIPPEEFARISAAVGWLFCDDGGREAYFVWERAGGVGSAFGKEFMGLGYRNVYYQETPPKFGGMREQTENPGWYPNKEARLDLFQEYRSALVNHRFINPSQEALEELEKFEWTKDGTDIKHSGERAENPTAGSVSHGDLGVSDALDWMLMQLKGGRPKPLDQPPGPVVAGWEWRRQRAEEEDREREQVW